MAKSLEKIVIKLFGYYKLTRVLSRSLMSLLTRFAASTEELLDPTTSEQYNVETWVKP
jgi:hypothetical protein